MGINLHSDHCPCCGAPVKKCQKCGHVEYEPPFVPMVPWTPAMPWQPYYPPYQPIWYSEPSGTRIITYTTGSTDSFKA